MHAFLSGQNLAIALGLIFQVKGWCFEYTDP